MKIALVHDYIKEYGGAERVLEAFHEIWPDAPVYTSVYLPQFLGPHRKRYEGWDIRTSWAQKIPFVEKLISPLRVLSPWIFDNLDLSAYDLVVVSATGAYTPNLIVTKTHTRHITYVHTPPRYLYGYPTARNWKNNLLGRILGEWINHQLRIFDFISTQRPHQIIVNSKEVQRRVRKFYRRESAVIYPPVEMVDQANNIKHKTYSTKSSYYLTGGRLARPKHIELAIEACNKLKAPLKIFGKPFAGYGEYLHSIAGPTIEFVGEVDDDKLMKLYAGCIALIYPSENEDFGIMPVEAQAFGKPVVCYRSGGVLETVIENKTGMFFDELTAESIEKAMKRLSNNTINPDECTKNAARFSDKRFKREILQFVRYNTRNG